MKKFLFILVCIIQFICTYAQDGYYYFYDEYKEEQDSLPIFGITKTDNIFVLGIKEFDTLVFVLPDFNCLSNHSGVNFKQVITEKQNLYVYFDLPYFEDFNYHIFDSIYYQYISNSSLIWEYILPNLSNEYAELIKKTYPKKYSPNNSSFQKEEEYECYRIKQINHNFFLCLLMKVSFYNKIRSRVSNSDYIFKDSKFEEGLYIKVLIPLKEE